MSRRLSRGVFALASVATVLSGGILAFTSPVAAAPFTVTPVSKAGKMMCAFKAKETVRIRSEKKIADGNTVAQINKGQTVYSDTYGPKPAKCEWSAPGGSYKVCQKKGRSDVWTLFDGKIGRKHYQGWVPLKCLHTPKPVRH